VSYGVQVIIKGSSACHSLDATFCNREKMLPMGTEIGIYFRLGHDIIILVCLPAHRTIVAENNFLKDQGVNAGPFRPSTVYAHVPWLKGKMEQRG